MQKVVKIHLDNAGPKLQMNELDEPRCDDYDNAHIVKKKMKLAHKLTILIYI